MTPLAGLRVLDLTRLLPGPFLSQLLHDLGAEVVKVEDPNGGDYARWITPEVDGAGYAFSAVNRGKRSVSVDLKAAGAADVVLRLAAGSDVLLESFRPGVMERLGLGDAELERANPRLVRASLVGYPQGEHRDDVGHDINYQALAGTLGDGQPGAAQLADISGALYAAVGVLAALHERQRSGKGRRLEIALSDAAVSANALALAHALAHPPEDAEPFALAGTLPGYRTYACRDGKRVALGTLEPKFWDRFLEATGRGDLAALHLDPAGVPALEELFRERDAEEWLLALTKAGVPITPVLSPREAAALHAGRLGPGAALGGSPKHGHVPELGEHTVEVLREAGFADETIAALLARRVVASSRDEAKAF